MPAPEQPIHRLKVATWNVHGSARPDVRRLSAVLAAIRPDVVGVQEIRSRQARRLADALGWQHRWVRKHLPYGPLLWWRAEGMAVLSPHDLDGNERTVLNPASSPYSYRRRVAQRTTLDLGDGARVLVANVHLASHDAPAERIAQATVVAGLLAAEPAEIRQRAVVVGDFNAADEPTALEPLAALGLHDTWPAGAGPGHTNPASRPSQRLDYVLAGPAWRITGAEVLATDETAVLSDHLPVAVDMIGVDDSQTRSK